MTGFYLTLQILYKSLIDVNGTSTILDTNVHSNFQNFRMLHMTKAHDDETYLQPDEYSSDACIDHLIVLHEWTVYDNRPDSARGIRECSVLFANKSSRCPTE
jgi:hypothetical protein